MSRGDDHGIALLTPQQCGLGGRRGYPSTRLLGRLISEPQNPLWDDKNTSEVEDTAQIMRRAYAETDAELTARLSRDHTTWRWGGLHVQTSRHQILEGEELPGFIRDHFRRKPRAVGGGPEIPNANSYDESVKDNGQVDYEMVGGSLHAHGGGSERRRPGPTGFPREAPVTRGRHTSRTNSRPGPRVSSSTGPSVVRLSPRRHGTP